MAGSWPSGDISTPTNSKWGPRNVHFFQFQRDAEVKANTKDNVKEEEQVGNGIRPQQSVINNLAGAIECRGEGRMSMGMARPHAAEVKHKGNVNSGSINGPKCITLHVYFMWPGQKTPTCPWCYQPQQSDEIQTWNLK